jgi:hypothetical protein
MEKSKKTSSAGKAISIQHAAVRHQNFLEQCIVVFRIPAFQRNEEQEDMLMEATRPAPFYNSLHTQKLDHIHRLVTK